MAMKKVVAYVQGGTGNQLFIFFAGLSIASRSHAKLVIDTSLLGVANIRHQGGLQDFEIRINGKLIDFKLRRAVKPIFVINAERIAYRLLNFAPFTRRFLRQYRSRVTGYDPMIDRVSPSIGIIGYFQSYKHISKVDSCGRLIDITLKSPSMWFRETSDQIVKSGTSVAIHMRRGDYLLNTQNLGLLTDEYFLRVLSGIFESHEISKVFIFSDSLESARDLQAKILICPSEVIMPPDNQHPVESLLLQSLCNFKIISNSTFSWWSAYLSAYPENVFAPTPWYRNQDEPDFLIPDNWQRRNAIWSD
jgi:hypothetical protein